MAICSWEGWAFIPGPLRAADVPRSTVVLQDVATYPPQQVAETLLAYPGFRLLHPPAPSWWEWKARWQRRGRFLVVNMTLYETQPVAWGGSEITEGRCEPGDLLAMWLGLRKKCRRLWLQHYDEMYTPGLFEQEFGL